MQPGGVQAHRATILPRSHSCHANRRSGPCQIGSPRGAWRPGTFQQIKRHCHGPVLRRGIARASCRVAQRKVIEQKARYAHVFHDVQRTSHYDGRDTAGFQHACRQCHRLVTYRAIGHQNRRVNTIVQASAQQFGRIDFKRVRLGSVGRQSVKPRRNLCNAARNLRAFQRRQRKVGADIFSGGVIAIDGYMRNPQVGIVCGVARIHGIKLCSGVIRRAGALIALAWLIGCRGCHDSQTRLIKRNLQWPERHVIEMCPNIWRVIPKRQIIRPCALNIFYRFRHVSPSRWLWSGATSGYRI